MPQTISKRHLADRLASKLHLSQAVAANAVQLVFDEIVAELKAGNRLEFRDFGVFELVSRKPRTALNPKTMQKVQVPSRTVVKFRPGRLLKGLVKDVPLAPESDGAPPAAEGATPPSGA
ncbi:MAG: HU family DNA-binding protein [Planctomycetota bacterium]|nr:integration host factor subunit beta [Planctomycetota bacterium]MDW8373795.1 HU family DNA-binding protein [Planctomycetota bacterium]